MTLEEFRAEVIRRGIESAKKHETEHRLRGAIRGFRIARLLPLTPMSWVNIIHVRQRKEAEMIGSASDEMYWEHRFATLQIEFVFERLKAVWQIGPLSTRAVLQYEDILREDAANENP